MIKSHLGSHSKGKGARTPNKKKMIIRLMIKVFAVVLLAAGTLLYFKDFLDVNPWEENRNAAYEAYKNGNPVAAEKHLIRALKEAERFALGDTRLHLTLQELMEFYNAQSDYEKAEPVIRRLLEIDEKILGPDHTNVAASLNNLAENYRAQDKLDKAKPLYERALKIFETNLGKDHPITVRVNQRIEELRNESPPQRDHASQ